MYYFLVLPIMCIVAAIWAVAKATGWKALEKIMLVLFIILTIIFVILYFHYKSIWFF